MVDPRVVLQTIMKSQNVAGNTMLQNAIGMMESGNTRGIQTLVENYCKTNGIDLEQAKRQIEQMYRR